MKKKILLFAGCFAALTFTVDAQKAPIKFDFENGLPSTITKYCEEAMSTRYDDAVAIENPHKEGINLSSKVLKFNNTSGNLQWQGFKFKLDTPIPLTEMAADSIVKLTVKYYEETPYVKSSNPSVKLLLTWNGQYRDADNVLQENVALWGTDNAGGLARDINPWAVDGVLLPADARTIDHQQKWTEVDYAFNGTYGNMDGYNTTVSKYKEIVGIAISPVRGYATGPFPYTLLIDDITIHFKSSSTTSIKNTDIESEGLTVNINGDLAEIFFNAQAASNAEVSVYNVSGQLIGLQSVACSIGANKVDMAVPAKGIYVVKVKTNNGAVASKFVK